MTNIRIILLLICAISVGACSHSKQTTAQVVQSPQAEHNVSIGHGAALFSANCSACHGATGREGGIGPSLTHEGRKMNLEATIAWIKNPAPPMPKLYPSPLREQDVADVAAYVESL
ncbi:MAG: cytochrome c [Candidatus Eremiobacteraeota bacterium]|nr:cytochrome c [Candidatus Eremiobacteraeota bacterium]